MDVCFGGLYSGEIAMSDQQILGYIRASRESLDRSLAILRDMRSRYPGGYYQLETDIAPLVARQGELELAAGVDLSGGRLGFAILPIIVGGMALLGIGGWAWQQYQATSQSLSHIECVHRLEDQGWDSGKASLICSGRYGGTAQNITTVLKYAIILALGLGGIYLLTKVLK